MSDAYFNVLHPMPSMPSVLIHRDRSYRTFLRDIPAHLLGVKTANTNLTAFNLISVMNCETIFFYGNDYVSDQIWKNHIR